MLDVSGSMDEEVSMDASVATSTDGMVGRVFTRSFRPMLFASFVVLLLTGCASTQSVTSPDGSDHEVEGKASWYGEKFHGNQTASGATYNMYEMTAAHRTLPFGTRVRVTDRETGASVVVRINDRGPFVDGRVIDLSYQAARELGMIQRGVAEVELDVVNW